MVSIIITYHDEGKKFLLECIDSIENTIDIQDYEIIVVDDFSLTPVQVEGVTVIRHGENLGVGAAFDTGVAAAKYENIFLMACDVRFSLNRWASSMLAEINKHDKSVICTAVVPLQFEMPELDIATAKRFMKLDTHKGAEILYFIGDDTHKHQILEARWYPREFLPLRSPDYTPPTECYEVECVLGAFYGTTKSWYRYIDGFWGHKFWGCLEPLISLKTWMFGGRCLVAPSIEVAHYFRNQGSTAHAPREKYTIYKTHNRLLLASFLGELGTQLLEWLPDEEFVHKASELLPDDMGEKVKEYKKKTVFPIVNILKKFHDGKN